jgi:hypothetical protein
LNITGSRDRHLLGGGMCERVGAADRERVERQARIERRAAERLVGARDRRDGGPADVLDRIARFTRRLGRRFQPRLDGRSPQRRAHDQFDPLDRKLLGLPASEQPIDVMRQDPALEKARRHGQPHRIAVDAGEIHAGEPTQENVFSNGGAQLLPDPRPAFLIGAVFFDGHDGFSNIRVRMDRCTSPVPI